MTVKNFVLSVSRVPDGLKVLKGFAMRRGEVELLSEIKDKELELLPRVEGGQGQEHDPGLMSAKTLIVQAYNQVNFDVRISGLQKAKREIENDLFYK
jgi:hypothetical protein